MQVAHLAGLHVQGDGADAHLPVPRAVLVGNGDHARGSVRGHQPFEAAAHEVEVLRHKPGMALGLWENISLDECSLILPKGASLLMFTDGMTDCRDPKGEPFGLERIKLTLGNLEAHSAQEMCDRLFDTLMVHQDGSKQDDDVTLVAIHAAN